MMSRVQKGLVAGFAATLAVSVVEAVNMLFGHWAVAFPQLLAYVVQMPGNPAVGWVAHFAAGTLVLGPLFAILCPRLPTDTAATKGILFAVGAWLVMSLTVMPLANLGIFGAQAGFGTIAWLLVTHMIFGVALGRVFARMHGEVGHPKRIRPIAA